MTDVDIVSSLRLVFSTLQGLRKTEITGTVLEETPPLGEAAPTESKLKPENSIQNDKVICLECGAEMKVLTVRHLSSHDLSLKEYKKKHGFTMRTPLAAKALTKARSKTAKKRGLPENLKKFQEERRLEKAKPSTAETTGIVTAIQPRGTRLRKNNAV
jgi:predicted transcriptional regulator